MAVTFKMKKVKENKEKEDKIESRNDIVKRHLEHYNVKYIKDLDEKGKKFLDIALTSRGYKPTSKRGIK